MSDQTDPAVAVKLCPHCMVIRTIEMYPVDATRKSGRHPYCRVCAAALQKEWRENYPERHAAAQSRAYRRRKAKTSGGVAA